MMRGVKAARVHIVLGDEGSFRRERQPASASVIVRTDGGDDRSLGIAVRHLVAAAVPNLKAEQVTVLNVDGQLLASGSDTLESAPENLLGLEKSVAASVRANINMTLAPYLSLKNFEVSVAARLNADKIQTNETVYNPDQKVERSVRTVKEKNSAQNSTGQPTAGVQTNLPKTNNGSTDNKQSNDNSDKKEELTNFEVSSRQTTTTSAGYVIRNLSVALLINRAALTAALGDKATPEAIDKQVKDIEELVVSSAGLKKDRGDDVKISVVDFVDSSKDLEPVAGESYLEILEHQTGTLISAAAMVLVAAMAIFFGLRPVTRMLLEPPRTEASAGEAAEEDVGFAMQSALPGFSAEEPGGAPMLFRPSEAPDAYFEALIEKREKGPQRTLLKLVEFDEEQAVAILKQWIREGAPA